MTNPDKLFRRAHQAQLAGEFAKAARLYRELLQLAPRHFDAMYLLGTVLAMQGDLEAAASSLQAAAALAPGSAMIQANLGLVFKLQGRNEEAEAAFRQALVLDPKLPQAANNLASLLITRGRPVEAEALARQALDCGDRQAALYAYIQLANAQADQGRIEDAVDSLQTMVQAAPDNRTAWGNLLSFAQSDPRRGSEEIRALHSRWGESYPSPPRQAPAAKSAAIRVAYLSPDLAAHPVGLLLAPLLAAHDREAFRVSLYHDRASTDGVSEKLRAIDGVTWSPVVNLSDAQLAEKVRADGIDILVDLSGHLSGNRLPMFASRAAPVQATWLGYPGSTGLPAMDYAISDADFDPLAEGNEWYSERLLRLDRPAYCFAPPADAGEVRALPDGGGFRIGAFNGFRKINDDVIDAWSDVLKGIAGASLVMQARGLSDAALRQQVLDRFARRGIEPGRLELHPFADFDQHTSLVSTCHLCLDTWPWNGHMTTLNCLWMGVPTLTLRGNRRASRMGASIMTNLGLDRFVADSRQQFVERAQELADSRSDLVDLRRGLRARMRESALMDAPGLAAAMEGAYRAMLGRP